MTPRIVREPITGTRWIAHNAWHVALSWLPTFLVLAAFGLGWLVGRYF